MITGTVNGDLEAVEIQAIKAEPLIGMALLEHHLLEIEVVSSGG